MSKIVHRKMGLDPIFRLLVSTLACNTGVVDEDIDLVDAGIEIGRGFVDGSTIHEIKLQERDINAVVDCMNMLHHRGDLGLVATCEYDSVGRAAGQGDE